MKERKRYLAGKLGITEVTQSEEDGLWRTPDGTVIAYEEGDSMTDKVARIGVWPFVFPRGTRLDAAAKVHDYLYSCPACQVYYTREEADAYMREMHLAATEGHWLRVWVRPFHFLARTFGGRFWENEKTR